MQLSKRLEAVANLVTEHNRLADIGTDHAYLPIYLYENHKIPSAIAMDVRSGPLTCAKENIGRHGLKPYISTRLSDGLEKLKVGEADTVVIAGMGGNLTIRILSAQEEVLKSVKELVLQPQSEIEQVRLFLYQSGYQIEEEDMVWEDGKFYPMMRAVPVDEVKKIKKEELLFGPYLLKSKNLVLKQFLEKEEETCQKILAQLQDGESSRIQKRKLEVEEEKQLIQAVLKNVYGC